MLTEAEQNRLIIDNMSLVEPVASNYRGQKGIPFEELVAEGRAGLVNAARRWWFGCGKFTTFAIEGIDLSINNFVRDWQRLEAVGVSDLESLDKEFYEWQKFITTPYECWTSLDATPEELLLSFEQLGTDRQALSSAMIGLSERERYVVWARFLRDPPMTLNSIARTVKTGKDKWGISYARTVFIINRALKKLANVLNNIENKRGT